MHLTTGEVIRRVRSNTGMTQRELGALIGFTQPAVSQLEHDGPAVNDLRTLRRVARALQVPLAILVVESNEEADVNRRNFLRNGAIGAGLAVSVGAAHRAAATPPGVGGSIQVGASDVADIVASTNEIHELDLIVGVIACVGSPRTRCATPNNF